MNIEGLVQQHGNRLLRAAYFLCQSEPEAQDLVQETFCQVMTAQEHFRGESQDYTWLYGILRNQFLIQCRKKRRWFPLDLMLNRPAEEGDCLPEISRMETVQHLEMGLKGLPVQLREILMLRYVEELKVDEIARMLKIPAGTVKSRLHQAIREMQKRMVAANVNLVSAIGGGRHEM
jgi:RNA polymerase sigma-70 factor, ECF subfamily